MKGVNLGTDHLKIQFDCSRLTICINCRPRWPTTPRANLTLEKLLPGRDDRRCVSEWGEWTFDPLQAVCRHYFDPSGHSHSARLWLLNIHGFPRINNRIVTRWRLDKDKDCSSPSIRGFFFNKLNEVVVACTIMTPISVIENLLSAALNKQKLFIRYCEVSETEKYIRSGHKFLEPSRGSSCCGKVVE